MSEKEKRRKAFKRKKNTYLKLTSKDYLSLAGRGIVASLILNMVFYRSLIGIIPSVLVGVLYSKSEKKRLIEKKRNEFRMQFKEFLLLTNTGQRAGYSLENAIENSRGDLINCFGKKAPIVLLVNRVTVARRNGKEIDDVFTLAGKETDIDDITEFGEIYSLAYGKSGNMNRVMERTAEAIVEKLEILVEVYSKLNEKIYELKVMTIMPFLIVGYLSVSNPGFFEGMYGSHTGNLIMSLCLGLYVLAFAWGRKIVGIRV